MAAMDSYWLGRMQRDPFAPLPSKLKGKTGAMVPYTAAEQLSSARQLASDQMTPSGIPGSKTAPFGWQDFSDFHGQRQIMEQGRGNGYGVALPTETVTRGAGGQTIARGSGGNMGAGGDMDADAYGPTDPFGDKARMRKNLGLDLLAAQLAGTTLNNEGTGIRNQGDIIANRRASTMADSAEEDFSRARAQPRVGTPDWYSRRDTVARADADTSMDLADVDASRDARRYFMPEVTRQREDQNRTALDRAVLPAQVAAGSRNYVADRGYQGTQYKADASRKSPAEVFGAFMDDLSKTYGQDPRTGAANLPANAASLRDNIVNQGNQAMAPGGGGRPGGPAGPAGGQDVLANPQIQAQVQRARQAGWSDDEIRAYLSGR